MELLISPLSSSSNPIFIPYVESNPCVESNPYVESKPYVETRLKANIAKTILNFSKLNNPTIKYKQFVCFDCHEKRLVFSDSVAMPCVVCKGVKFYVSDILSNNVSIFKGTFRLECATCLEPVHKLRKSPCCPYCTSAELQYVILHEG